MLADSAFKGELTMERCVAINNVCHGLEVHDTYFFYMYMCLFTGLHMRVPFEEFTMGVWHILNMAPTQLHTNTWASLKGFRLLTEMFWLKPSPHVYLHSLNELVRGHSLLSLFVIL